MGILPVLVTYPESFGPSGLGKSGPEVSFIHGFGITEAGRVEPFVPGRLTTAGGKVSSVSKQAMIVLVASLASSGPCTSIETIPASSAG